MRKLIVLLLAMVMVFGVFSVAHAEDLIKVGVVNNPPSESGYREANVNDFQNVFTAENGYDAKFFYSIKNDEQLSAARQFITDGVDYLLISAAETTGWDAVLQDAKDAGIGVFLDQHLPGQAAQGALVGADRLVRGEPGGQPRVPVPCPPATGVVATEGEACSGAVIELRAVVGDLAHAQATRVDNPEIGAAIVQFGAHEARSFESMTSCQVSFSSSLMPYHGR